MRWKRGWAYSRFTWSGREFCVALGTKDAEQAATASARAYADVVSGRFRPIVRRPGKLLDLSELWDEWVEWKTPSIDPTTVPTLRYYGDRFVDFFKTLDRITEANGATYGTVRLGQVCRSTVTKELCFLRQFVRWAKQQGALDVVPAIPQLPPKATGRRVGKQRQKYVEVTPAEAERIIAKLPEMSKTIAGRRWPIRDRFSFAWETTLRPETVSRLSVPENWRPGMRHIVLTNEDDKARYGRDLDITPEALAVLRKHAPAAGLVFGEHCYYKAIKRAAIAVLGLVRGKSFAPYDFRHNRARALLDARAPLRGVSYLLGHIRPSTTDRYTAPDRRAGKAALAAHSRTRRNAS